MSSRQISSSSKHRRASHTHSDDFAPYWIWRGLFGSYFHAKQASKIQNSTRRLNHLRFQIFLQYLKNFFYFPIWFFKLLIPSYMKGKVNVWTNLKTIIREREFHPLRMAVFSQILFLYALGHLGYIGFVYYSTPTLAATYTFTQTSWSGGASSTAFAVHPGDQSGWNYFFSKDSLVTIDEVTGDVGLTLALQTEVDTSDQDFGAGSVSDVYVQGTGDSARLVLLKPNGASCTTGTQCVSGGCNGSNQCFTPPCAGLTELEYEGQTYDLVEIGTQCWFAESLNVGTKLASVSTMPSNSSLIEKWCYDNSDSNCTTYGALYTWAEALQLSHTCNSSSCSVSSPRQGICPAGWHVPTDTEVKTLEMFLGMTQVQADATSNRGTNEGTKLKTGGSSGFNAKLGGFRSGASTSFSDIGTTVYFWTSTQDSASNAWIRRLTSAEARVYRIGNIPKTWGMSVRCVKD